jgi:hypothetical protein
MHTKTSIASSQYGTPEPQVIIEGASHYRTAKSAAYRLAACVEELSETDRWCVVVEHLGIPYNSARVYLELHKGDAAEAKRGRIVLQQALNAAGM